MRRDGIKRWADTNEPVATAPAPATGLVRLQQGAHDEVFEEGVKWLNSL